MKIFLALPILALIMLALKPFGELPIGADMPKTDVKMKDINGKEVTLKDAKKKNGLLVMFSCNTCPYVIKNQGRTTEIGKYALANDIGVILINSNEAQRDNDDSYEAMRDYAKEQGYTWHYVVDKNSEIADAFGAKRTPECFLFNKEGKLVYHGAIDNNPGNQTAVNRHHLKEAINEMKTGKEIAIKETRSVGCGIKRKG
ncbi:MAG: thioredoxin family protein [Bacteroidota bacterium]|nr:thioredoxin family protein [Bacteroidota bacterium]